MFTGVISFMFSWRSHNENGELTERFPILENGRLIQDLCGIYRLGKLTVNEGFLAVSIWFPLIHINASNSWNPGSKKNLTFYAGVVNRSDSKTDDSEWSGVPK